MTAKFCPHCGSPLAIEDRPYASRGVYLGRFQFYVCSVCRRTYHPKQTSLAIQSAAKALGIWGLGAPKGLITPAPLLNLGFHLVSARSALSSSPVAKPLQVRAGRQRSVRPALTSLQTSPGVNYGSRWSNLVNAEAA